MVSAESMAASTEVLRRVAATEPRTPQEFEERFRKIAGELYPNLKLDWDIPLEYDI